jgi:hypothetical protein
MTPFELRLCLEARNENLVDDRARDLWHAWHTAYLGRVDKFPHLNELMPKILQHGKPEEAENKPKSSVGLDLMNALLKLPTAPPPPKDPPPEMTTGPAGPAAEESA